MNDIKRGEMFYISRGGASYNGSEQHADRPAVVVSNNKNNENSNVVEVVYMTTQPKTDLPTHVTIRSTGRISTVLCEQVYSVSTERIGTYIGEATDKEMENIDIALMISLQLDNGIKTAKEYYKTIKEQQEEIDSLKKEIEMLQQEHEDTIAEIEQDAAVYVEENKKIANMTQTEDTIRYINKWIAKKTKATRNAMILKVLNEMTKGKEVTVENLDSLKDIFNEQLDPAIADNAVVITNQSGFNYLDKLKDKDGNYILQKDPTQQTKGKMLFGEYPIIKLSKKTLASEKIMNTDGHTIDGYKHPIFCGDLKEAVTLFDRNVLTIDLNDKGAGLWDKDMTGIKVRDRFDVQPVDKGAVIKGQITEVING